MTLPRMDDDKREPKLPLKDFMDQGCLATINRQILHPIGLALWVNIYTDEMGVYDYQDDPEGVRYDDEAVGVLKERVEAYASLWQDKTPVRKKELGYVIQPIGDGNE